MPSCPVAEAVVNHLNNERPTERNGLTHRRVASVLYRAIVTTIRGTAWLLLHKPIQYWKQTPVSIDIGKHLMTTMAELQGRKQPINLAIVHVDPDAFIGSLMGWLEITAFISAQKAGTAKMPADGITPKLSADDLKNGGVRKRR